MNVVDGLNVTFDWSSLEDVFEGDQWYAELADALPPTNDDFWHSTLGAKFVGGQEKQVGSYQYALMVGSVSGDTVMLVSAHGRKPRGSK